LANYKDSRAKELIDLGNHLFTKKLPLNGLHQELAWQFAPDLAEFTSEITLGEDWASDRMDSAPEQLSRELTNSVGSMLRPQDKEWFRTTTGDDRIDADEGIARYLDYLTDTIRRSLYDSRTQFIGATKDADRFYVNFGQAVLSCEEAPGTRDHLFFRNFHLKDCAWLDDDLGEVDHLHRKQKMTARAMKKKFKEDSLHPSILRAASKEPNKEFEVRVITLPAEEYDDFTSDDNKGGRKGRKLPYVVCYVDVDNSKVIRDGGLVAFNYVVPRWHRMTGTQYAYSPATMPALADARMAQMLTQIILESGEKSIDPPMIGKQEMVIGEPTLHAGGISWVDMDHDMRLSDALDVVRIEADMRVGFEMRKDVREMLSKAFFIDKLMLPDAASRDMTAYEVARRWEEHIRNLLPIFEPIQVEYNARILDRAFALLSNMRKIDFSAMPEELSDANITWQFETPIQQAQQRMMVEQFMETTQLLAVGQQAGASANPVHVDTALRDAIRGVGGPAEWRKTQDEQQAEAEQNAQMALVQQGMQEAGEAAEVANKVGEAGQKLGLLPQGGSGGAQGGEVAPAAEGGQPAEGGGLPALLEGAMDGVTALQPVENEEDMSPEQYDQLMRAFRRMSYDIADLKETINQPKKITVTRDKSGRVSGAKAVSAPEDQNQPKITDQQGA